jgi:hypothetical protein
MQGIIKPNAIGHCRQLIQREVKQPAATQYSNVFESLSSNGSRHKCPGQCQVFIPGSLNLNISVNQTLAFRPETYPVYQVSGYPPFTPDRNKTIQLPQKE